MTPAGFRRIALALEGAVEGATRACGFRVANRVFASLGYPDSLTACRPNAPQQRAHLRNTRRRSSQSKGNGRAGLHARAPAIRR